MRRPFVPVTALPVLLACSLFLAPVTLAAGTALPWTKLDHGGVLLPCHGEPSAILVKSVDSKTRVLHLWKETIRDGKLVDEDAGELPAGILRLEAFPGGEGKPPALLVCQRGRIGVLAAGEDGTFEIDDLVPVVEDDRLVPEELVVRDVDGDGTDDVLVESWAGILLLKGTGPASWKAAGWYPTARRAFLSDDSVSLETGGPVAPADRRPLLRTWAQAESRGRLLAFRGTPIEAISPAPSSKVPPLLARVRLPAAYGAEITSLLLPGSPDRVARIAGLPEGKGLSLRPHLVVFPLCPRETGVPEEPELVVPLPGSLFRSPPDLRVGDADGDGTEDLLLAREAGRKTVEVVVYRGRGPEGFEGRPVTWTGRPGRGAHLLHVGDLDGDGATDVLARARGTVLLWRGGRSSGQDAPFGTNPAIRWKLPWKKGYALWPVRVLRADGHRWLLMKAIPESPSPANLLLALPLP